MNWKKIAMNVILVGIVFSVGMNVNAKQLGDVMTNEQGVEISEQQYQKLKDLGFTENQILYMTREEYEANKDVNGHVVSEEVTYFKKVDGIEKEVSKEEYDAPEIALFGMQAGYIETGAKKMTTRIISTNGRYRYKVDLEWKSLPSVRSHDILGIGIDNNVKIYANVYFQQNFCYSANNCSSSTVHAKKNTSTGGSASFKIPSATLTSLSSYLYFDVVKNTNSTITELHAYGDYSHAKKSITDVNATKYMITKAGIILDDSIENYYDAIPSAKAIWTGSW